MKEKVVRTQCNNDLTFLRLPELSDCAEFTKNAVDSVDFHRNLVSPARSRKDFEEYIAKNDTETDRCFLLIEKATGSIAGAINISQIFLKGFRSAYIGYCLFEGFTGRGLMTDGLGCLLYRAFSDIGLHRLEANIQPHNKESIALVKRCGFTKEGFSRKYLMIGGEWCDHERWAIVREDWEGKHT